MKIPRSFDSEVFSAVMAVFGPRGLVEVFNVGVRTNLSDFI